MLQDLVPLTGRQLGFGSNQATNSLCAQASRMVAASASILGPGQPTGTILGRATPMHICAEDYRNLFAEGGGSNALT